MDIVRPLQKPQLLVYPHRRLSGGARDLWRDCTLAWPLLSHGDNRAADHSRRGNDGLPGESAHQLAVIRHEAGTLGEWHSVANAGNATHGVTAAVAAALNGTAGGLKLALTSDAGQGAGTVKNVAYRLKWTTRYMRIAFRIDPNTITADNQQLHFLRTTTSGGLVRDGFRLSKISGVYKIRADMTLDNATVVNSQFQEILDAPNLIEALWTRSTSAIATDGSLELWINGTPITPVTGLTRYSLSEPADLRCGILQGSVAAWNGSIYLDELTVRDDATEIAGNPWAGTGALVWRAGLHGAAVDCSSGVDQLQVPDQANDTLDGAAVMSWEVFFSADTIPGGGVKAGLLSKYMPRSTLRAWRIYLLGEEIVLDISAAGADSNLYTTTAANLVAGTWYRLVVTFDAGAVAIYLNGVLQTITSPGSPPTTIWATDAAMVAGALVTDLGAPADHLDGAISCVRIWRGRELIADEVRTIEMDPWGMFRESAEFPWGVVEHTGGMAAGLWELVSTVPAGDEMALVTGLENGIEYDFTLRTVDVSGNPSPEGGGDVVSATPVTGVTSPRAVPLRFPRGIVGPAPPIRRFL